MCISKHLCFLVGILLFLPATLSARTKDHCLTLEQCSSPPLNNTATCWGGSCSDCPSVITDGVEYVTVDYDESACAAVCSEPGTATGLAECTSIYPKENRFCQYISNVPGYDSNSSRLLVNNGSSFSFIGLCEPCHNGATPSEDGSGCLTDEMVSAPLASLTPLSAPGPSSPSPPQGCKSVGDCQYASEEGVSTLCTWGVCRSCQPIRTGAELFYQASQNETTCAPVCGKPDSYTGVNECRSICSKTSGYAEAYCKSLLNMGYQKIPHHFRDHAGNDSTYYGLCIRCEKGMVPHQDGDKCVNKGSVGALAPHNNPSEFYMVGISVFVGFILLAIIGAFYLHSKARNKHEIFDGLKVYTYSALRNATSDFKEPLGDGSSAEVFRGTLDGQVVAVKRLKDGNEYESTEREFSEEARNLGRLLHKNVVQLLGFSNDTKRPKMLVYEFVHGGTLDSLLYGEKKQKPSFNRRMEIALGIARGIEYCHHMIEPAILHRDIKPLNILMTSSDEHAIPKLADFGLARMLDSAEKGNKASVIINMPKMMRQVSNTRQGSFKHPDPIKEKEAAAGLLGLTSAVPESGLIPKSGAAFSAVAGTKGYIDPEYFTTFRATLKSDVFSFGAVLLELIMGQRPRRVHSNLVIKLGGQDSRETVVLAYTYWLRKLLALGEAEVKATVVSMLGRQDFDAHQCFKALRIACQCLEDKGKMRPPMRQVVRMLEELRLS